ncbi:PadR family transcriptional regulator [Rhodococcus coprophilus]|uniref:PadR family transcriptional regulator n=1 Tax=Rhodococcus coprophilus TaxID=38310 RepID=A0A2X4UCA3_9NOCA|nr:PadR family transcriptional regulator [Rhodococcus coprophilus]
MVHCRCYAFVVSEPESEQYPALPPTSWAVLGMLSFGEELTGNELKKWADWSIGFYYWSPSVSQVYAELKKLEKLGLVQSRLVNEPGTRGRRLYAITESGIDAVRTWSREAPVEMPVLKHGVMLRMYMGHLNDPDQLKAIVREHIVNLEDKLRRAGEHAEHSDREPGWAFSQMSLRWAERYFRAEIELSNELLDDIDRAAAQFARSDIDDLGLPRPRNPGSWNGVSEGLGGDNVEPSSTNEADTQAY